MDPLLQYYVEQLSKDWSSVGVSDLAYSETPGNETPEPREWWMKVEDYGNIPLGMSSPHILELQVYDADGIAMEEGEPEIPIPQETHVPGPLELVPVCESHSGGDIETGKVITRDGKVFGVKFVTPENLTNELSQDDAYNIMDRRLFTVTEFMDDCCYDRSCVNNFEGLPDRLLSAPFEYLYYDIDGRPGYCKEKTVDFPCEEVMPWHINSIEFVEQQRITYAMNWDGTVLGWKITS